MYVQCIMLQQRCRRSCEFHADLHMEHQGWILGIQGIWSPLFIVKLLSLFVCRVLHVGSILAVCACICKVICKSSLSSC